MISHFSIKVNHLSKRLGQNQALNDVSLHFEAEKMHGVIGPEGAGKTTLMRLMAGLLKPDWGSIEFLEKEVVQSFENIRFKIAYMPQQQSLYPDLSIDEHLDFFKKLYQIQDEEYEKRKKELLNMTRLDPFLDRLASQLSGGMYKKLGLMCALLRSPDILLLDEPTNGVDPISRREFWDLLYRLLDQKILIIVTTAYMDEAERCSMVHLLESGKVINEGEPQDLLQKSNVRGFDELFREHGKSSL